MKMKKFAFAAAMAAAVAAFGAARDEMKGGQQVGVSLFDGKVIVAGTTLGTGGKPAYVLKDLPSGEGVKTETKASENAVLVKYVFPKATELRVQVDYGFGFPEGTKVRVMRTTDELIEAKVDAPDGVWYFCSKFSTIYARPGMFADGQPLLFAQEVAGAAPCGCIHECFYGEDGDDIQVKTAMSRVSAADARAKLKGEMPGFLPAHRPLIWQFKERNPTREPMKGDLKSPSLPFIQRTMKKIVESTAENPATVRVLFYGQSIVWQQWNRLMMKELQERYPTVNFIWKNLAVGGWEANILSGVFPHDVPAFYPDILFFHDYGDMKLYEQMVRCARETTAAEIVLWTSHLAGRDDLKAFTEKRDERSLAILDIARRYNCHVIDLNRKWCDLCNRHGWSQNDLVCDGIHLNGLGNWYYKDFIQEELLRLPGCDGDEAKTGSDRFYARDDASVKTLTDGTLEFSFDGNRVTAVSDGTGAADLKAEVRLDGRPLAASTDHWATTRPSAMLAWFPGLYQFGFGKTQPIEEDLTLEIIPNRADDPKEKVSHGFQIWGGDKFVPVRFKVTSSVTGDEGEGLSSGTFVSKSGRLVIPPKAWLSWPQWGGGDPHVGARTQWKSYPLFTDVWTAKPAGEETLLVQGCANAAHKLTIRLPKGAKGGIRGFRVWKPATEISK